MPLRGIIIRNRMEAPRYPPMIGQIPLRPAPISRLFAVRAGFMLSIIRAASEALLSSPFSFLSLEQ
jgi:hypothetical protein